MISQKLDVVRWTKTFFDFLSRVVGAKNTQLTNIVRILDVLDCTTPFVLMEYRCHTEEARCLEEE